jgi:nucleotide-binding universal stress UspA family protein
MTKPAHVLAVTDFSTGSDEALRQAYAYARLAGAKLSVLHVIPDVLRSNPLFPQSGMDDINTEVALEKSALDQIGARVQDVLGEEDAGVELGVRVGPVDVSVMQYAEDNKVDLVVTGATGRTGLARLFLGSTAERIVRYSHCSVLVARPVAARGHVLAATDLSDAALPAVQRAKVEAQIRGARLHLVHSVDFSGIGWAAAAVPLGAAPVAGLEEKMAELRAIAKESLQGLGGPEAVVHMTDGPPKRAIVTLAESLPAELVVVATHGRTGLSRLALGSVAEAVVRAAPCSVLVVRAAQPPAIDIGV